MAGKVKWARGERFVREARFLVPALAEEVFPLLCPVREYEWIPDWSCEMIYSETGLAERGAVFTTMERPLGRMLWTCILHEPPWRVAYLLTFKASASILLDVELADREDGRCELSWMMSFTTRSKAMGFLLRKRMSEEAFARMIRSREEQLAEFFQRKAMGAKGDA